VASLDFQDSPNVYVPDGLHSKSLTPSADSMDETVARDIRVKFLGTSGLGAKPSTGGWQ